MDTPTTEQEETKQIAPDSEQLVSIVPGDDDESPDAIFFKAVAEIPTQPLVLISGKTLQEKAQERRVLVVILLFFLSFVGASVLAVVTYPTVTITVIPISKSVSVTAQLDLPTRTLKPASMSQMQRAPTTGTGYQPAAQATGILTFYNGLATAQTLPAGIVFTGHDGMKVELDQAVTITAANLPQVGEATSVATAVEPGTSGNIPIGDMNATIRSGVVVKNLAVFTGGRNARTYRAVAKRDLDTVTATLKQRLTQAIPQAFSVQAGEALYLTYCVFTASPNHQEGVEAQTVTVKAKETCDAVAYNVQQLQQRATTALTAQTSPGAHYLLLGTVTPTLTSVAPMTVTIHGLWVYNLSQSYEQFLASHIAGDSPQQARTYLLHTGCIVRVNVTRQLPKDPQHIKFLQVVGI